MNIGAFTFEEINLMCIYNTGSRCGLMDSLSEMRQYLGPDDTDLLHMTDSALAKLQQLSDGEFDKLDLVPEFDL